MAECVCWKCGKTFQRKPEKRPVSLRFGSSEVKKPRVVMETCPHCDTENKIEEPADER